MKKVVALLVLFSFFSCALSARVIGYWGASPGGHPSTVDQLQTAVSKGYNVVIFAFYDVDASGNLIKDPGAVDPPKKSSISSGSFLYLVSLFGGENGAAPSITLPADQWAKAMYNNFLTLHNTLGFDGIDIDLENAWGGTPTTVECGLRSFFALMHNSSFTVSMAPQTTAVTPEVSIYEAGSWNSYVPLVDTSVIKYVDIVAVQLYNNAVPGNSVSGYAQSLESGFAVTGCPSCSGLTCKVAIPAKKIAFGFPAGPGAAPSGCPGLPGGCPYGSALTSLYNSNSLLSNTSGVMTWSIEWDQASNWEFVAAATKISFH